LQRLRGRKPSDPCRGCSNFLCDMMAATCNEQPNAPQQRNAKDYTRRPKWFYIRFCCFLGFLADDMLDGQTLPSPKSQRNECTETWNGLWRSHQMVIAQIPMN
jgi:hypothetical protein